MKSWFCYPFFGLLFALMLTGTVGCEIMTTPVQNSVLRRKSTAELQLRHSQLEQRLGTKNTEFRVGPFGGGTKNHEDEWKEKERIERELLKRYQAGDKEAFLPIFKSATVKEQTEIKVNN